MDELINRITASAGIDAATAREAVSTILTFLYQEGDREKMTELADKLPGATEFIDLSDPDDAATFGGGLGSLMGGGAMAVLGKLQALGLGMGQIQSVAQQTVAYAREKAGAALVDDIVGSIPGLSQFV